MRVLIRVCYDGSGFFGWQIQPNLRTVEGELTAAVERICGLRVPVVGSGRTDTGVHALSQAAHFDLERDFDLAKLPHALNFYLDDDVRVMSAMRVDDDFHARKSAKNKTYIYRMYQAPIDNPLLKNRQLRVEGVDVRAMNEAAKMLVGVHDFRGFMSSGSSVRSSVREIFECKVSQIGNEICLRVSANGFLYNMVRKIVAALLIVGSGRKGMEIVERALIDFEVIKELAPAFGLYLYDVEY